MEVNSKKTHREDNTVKAVEHPDMLWTREEQQVD